MGNAVRNPAPATSSGTLTETERQDQDQGQEAVREEHGKEQGKESGKEYGRESEMESGRESGRESGMESGKESGKESVTGIPEDYPPALCPIDNCMELVAHSQLLRHIMSVHLDFMPLEAIPVQTQMQELATGAMTLLLLDYRHMPLGRDLCLAVLNWRADTCGGDLSVPQRDLPASLEALSLHVPILVMVCRTTWKSVLTPPSLRPGPHEPRDVSRELGQLLLIWLLCPAIRRPVAVSLGIINSELKLLMRPRLLLRNFATRLHINHFLAAPDPYFLHIEEEDLEELCDAGKSAVFLQLVIEGELESPITN